MNKIKFDMNDMKFISLFESISHSNVKDCINTSDLMIFVVNVGEIGKAVGQHGSNVRRMEEIVKKKVKVVEFSNDVMKFIENYIFPMKAKDMKQENKIIKITSPDLKTRGYLIGKGAEALRKMESVVKRHFDIEEIKVV